MKYIAIICIVLYFIKMLHSLYNHDEAYAGWLCAIMWAVIFLIKFGSE